MSWYTSVSVLKQLSPILLKGLSVFGGAEVLWGWPAPLGLAEGSVGGICNFSKEMGSYEGEWSSPDSGYLMDFWFLTPHPCSTLTLCCLKQTTGPIAGEPGQRKSFHFTEGWSQGRCFIWKLWIRPFLQIQRNSPLLQELKTFSSIWKVAWSPVLVLLPFLFLCFCSVRKKK